MLKLSSSPVPTENSVQGRTASTIAMTGVPCETNE